MYRRKLLILLSLLGAGVGLFFVFKFYQLFFWSNTQFENDSSIVFIDRDDTIDSLAFQLTPLLKSTERFLSRSRKKRIRSAGTIWEIQYSQRDGETMTSSIAFVPKD
jgi:hypothetical protein